eukprot:CAMPEP_0183411280 /NCGR_PEP_ID=MMETSP0370-20130417/20205_1 /TAXON_ID=268820 /ORGANISM="Peridinium aciculiferum, Strain PAER-2" /LENGTH=86 /DNA_ID=CAMNT_0025594243 /DNA_START=157 /DNA_END=417 /DNA_ORIENTATION=+
MNAASDFPRFGAVVALPSSTYKLSCPCGRAMRAAPTRHKASAAFPSTGEPSAAATAVFEPWTPGSEQVAFVPSTPESLFVICPERT